MKILVINTCPFYYDGITNVILNLYNSVDSNIIQYDVMVVKKPHKEFVNIITNKGGHLFYHSRDKKNIIKYFSYLISLIKKQKYDAVHVHGNSRSVTIELLAAYLSNCKCRIVHSHNTFTKYPIIHLFMTPIFKLLCTDALACGREAGKFMFGNRNFLIVKNGIVLSRFQFDSSNRIEIRKKYNIMNKIVIGHVGSLNNEHKNQKYLIDILEMLTRKDSNYYLLLVGDGKDRRNIEKQIREKDLESYVTIVGSVDDTSKYLSAMDMVLMPSNYEGLPLSLIEEQASGLSCYVSSNITQDVNLSGNVKFLSLDNVSEWINTVLQNNILSDDERKTKSNEAMNCIKDLGYSIEDEVTKLTQFYLRINKSSRGQ